MTFFLRAIIQVASLSVAFAPVAAAASNAAAVRSVRADLAAICAGKIANLEIAFRDSNGYDNTVAAKGNKVYAYRSTGPESIDWNTNDNYVFLRNSGNRLHFSRSVIYAAQNYSYILTIDKHNIRQDNAAALPTGIYFTDERILTNLKQICQLRPVAAE